MTWWDNESDGDKLYPKEQHNPSQSEEHEKLNRNPAGVSRQAADDSNYIALPLLSQSPVRRPT